MRDESPDTQTCPGVDRRECGVIGVDRPGVADDATSSTSGGLRIMSVCAPSASDPHTASFLLRPSRLLSSTACPGVGRDFSACMATCTSRNAGDKVDACGSAGRAAIVEPTIADGRRRTDCSDFTRRRRARVAWQGVLSTRVAFVRLGQTLVIAMAWCGIGSERRVPGGLLSGQIGEVAVGIDVCQLLAGGGVGSDGAPSAASASGPASRRDAGRAQ